MNNNFVIKFENASTSRSERSARITFVKSHLRPILQNLWLLPSANDEMQISHPGYQGSPTTWPQPTSLLIVQEARASIKGTEAKAHRGMEKNTVTSSLLGAGPCRGVCFYITSFNSHSNLMQKEITSLVQTRKQTLTSWKKKLRARMRK